MFVVNAMPDAISPALIDQLARTSTGTVGHILDAGFMDCGMVARMLGRKIVGTAVTLRVTVPDSSIGHYALKHIRAGDVLVIDRGADQNVACWGGTSSAAAVKRGLQGVIMDGAGHDIALANRVGLPIWCRRVTPITTKHRALGGALNVQISCGGVVVNPGDAVLADDNGVLILPRSDVEAVAAAAVRFDEMKAAILERIANEPDFSFPDETGATRIVEDALKKQALQSA